MEFGLSRIIEMFEERFGKRLTTLVTAIIVLALVCVAAKAIIIDFIRPSYGLVLEAVRTGTFNRFKSG